MATLPRRVPKIFLASSTAAKLMETAEEATPVSVRTRLATEKAFVESRLMTTPEAWCLRARR